MVTYVGTQKEFSDALKALLELEYDAVEAYKAAIERLESKAYKKKLEEFKSDHLNHIDRITKLLESNHHVAPQSGDNTKRLLAKGKVILANLIGDETILSAMISNEQDTNKAYERILERDDLWDESIGQLESFLKDERRHKSWLEQEIGK